jgi:hypothetical protein
MCKVDKVESDFSKNASRKDGLNPRCKSCMREYEQTDKRKAYMKVYEQTDKRKMSKQTDKRKAYMKHYMKAYRLRKATTHDLGDTRIHCGLS